MGGDLLSFVSESNQIEGIIPYKPMRSEIEAHKAFLDLRPEELAISHIAGFVNVVARAELRVKKGMNVSIGKHLPPAGGPEVASSLNMILALLIGAPEVTPFEIHQRYEHLHPFMDGNGRSGRVLWAWHRKQIGRDPFALGFLHSWYYESLEHGR